MPARPAITQPLGQHVVGELGHRPLPGGAPHRELGRPASSSSALERGGHVAGSSGGRTTMPVSPSTTASAAPPESPATCGTPHAAASTNTMPKPSCSSPPQRLRHGIVYTSRAAVEPRADRRCGPGRGSAPGASELAGQALQAVEVAAAAGDREDEVRARPAQRRRGPDRRVEALAWHQAADARRSARQSAGSPKCSRASSRSASVERAEALRVDARRHDRDRQRAAGGVLGLSRRVAAGRDDVAGPAQHPRERLLAAGQPAGHGDLGAVEDHVVRQLQRRPDEAERQRGVEHDEVGAEVARQSIRCGAPSAGAASSTGSRVRSMRNGWAVSNSAAPAYGLVSTANESGGRRRHHSHSNDWMPPILGGKSFVTSRCFTARIPSGRPLRSRRARRGRADRSRSRRSMSWSPRWAAAQTAWARSIGSA